MNKITILGFLIVIDQHAAGPQSPTSPSDGRHYPTLDDLFAHATRSREEEAEESWKEKYGPIFT